MGGGARSAPLGVAMSPKRRVRIAQSRAQEYIIAKPRWSSGEIERGQIRKGGCE